MTRLQTSGRLQGDASLQSECSYNLSARSENTIINVIGVYRVRSPDNDIQCSFLDCLLHTVSSTSELSYLFLSTGNHVFP